MAKINKKSKEDLKGMQKSELEKKMAALGDEIRTIKWKAEGARSKNVKEISNLKKQVARILTQINSVKQ